MALVRSITFFIPMNISNEYFKDNLEKYLDTSIEILKNIDIEPWTVRYVFTPIYNRIDKRKCNEMIEFIYDKLEVKNALIHALAIPSSSACIEYLTDILSSFNTLYSTIYLENFRDVRNLVDKIYMEKSLEYDVFTRLSITHYIWVQTPYFPSTVNLDGEFSFGLALRYVDLMKLYLKGDKKAMEMFLIKLRDSLGDHLKYLRGIDYSLSPWMNESVAQLVEDIYKISIGEVGILNAIYRLNMEIRRIVNKGIISGIGFNEVMLPVGEDNVLKERVEEGRLNLRTLISLASVCVAGLDMVAIDKERRLIEGTIYDINSIAYVKRRGIGTRIIPTEEDYVSSMRFGNIPKIRV